ncbi:MAG TPA: RuBisCO large subunit C-terminal-like domain-containing protein [Candidatus Sulfotelmatobacter sp.]|nr:RuBisCO large subunit C-terminal-like domain-containing protein [Candidatus Sulfotelmatobacter sp.]
MPAREARFSAVYRVSGGMPSARSRAWEICLEQTVELPHGLVPSGFVRDHVVGKVESLEASSSGCLATISYPVGTSAGELAQLLNVLFGNTSIKPGVRLERLILPPALLRRFAGPRFGVAGLRQRLGAQHRPLLCAALKPMGLSAEALADLAYCFALGGIDIVKDDHGLSNQPYAPFEERVRRCAAAVARANRKTGFRSVYAPNVTAPHEELVARARFARGAGAGALLFAPGLAGLDAMRTLADNSRVGLPILSHPALQGSYVLHPDSGISHYALFGQIARLAGADASIYPNYGGRFSFSREECASIVEGCRVKMDRLRPIFPCPGGGMQLNQVPELLRFYGTQAVFLLGRGLLEHGPDVVENCRVFRRMVEHGTKTS